VEETANQHSQLWCCTAITPH